jgi:hypothetical protein
LWMSQHVTYFWKGLGTAVDFITGVSKRKSSVKEKVYFYTNQSMYRFTIQ